MRLTILVLGVLLVFVTLNYILKCLEYKDLRDLFDNRGRSIKMLNETVEDCNARIHAKNIEINMQHSAKERLLNHLYNNGAEVARLRHKVYVLRKDIKRKDRAIVRYKKTNEVFKHGYHKSESRCAELLGALMIEQQVSKPFVSYYLKYKNERDAYLYCLRQIQEEVENATKE